MSQIRFRKMHGLGNDFIIIDARVQLVDALTPDVIAAVSDRQRGIGGDQVVVLESAMRSDADVFMRIYNPDGRECEACGNATRCVGALMLAETGRDRVAIQTVAGMLYAWRQGTHYAVDMGVPQTQWDAIPLAQATDTLHVDVALGPLADPVATSMGNPHVTFFVPDLAAIDMTALGAPLERHPMFPQRANIGVAQVLASDRLRLRVWERGPGLTLACGTGSCAALVAAHRRGLTDRRATVELDGGALVIEWLDNGRVESTGPVSYAFEGVFETADYVVQREALAVA
ncbi:diaminopimelate epimerase [Pigmentiphaga aceris]|uniref:diaminopimelate epimerase n=1 Tax=Pigmentiphaga aceris TaxID=1940612 RepID=UPI001CA341BE|nr:diaminopimelate epimerase [Pigmentiphaga aceris]